MNENEISYNGLEDCVI